MDYANQDVMGGGGREGGGGEEGEGDRGGGILWGLCTRLLSHHTYMP